MRDPNIILVRQGPEAIKQLSNLINCLKKGDALAPVTVIGPSVYSNLYLRHNLGLSGFVNIRFLVLSRLSEFLGAPSLARKGSKPMTLSIESSAIRTVASDMSGILSDLKSHPAMLTSLKRTFRSLNYTSPDALHRLKKESSLRREIVGSYERFSDKVELFYDREKTN